MYSSSIPENIRKSYSFLMFSGGREMIHREQMGLNRNDRNHNTTTDMSPKYAQETFTDSKWAIVTLEEGAKYVKS